MDLVICDDRWVCVEGKAVGICQDPEMRNNWSKLIIKEDTSSDIFVLLNVGKERTVMEGNTIHFVEREKFE
jgi:hypothetical protein